jgi:hypothetical protein
MVLMVMLLPLMIMMMAVIPLGAYLLAGGVCDVVEQVVDLVLEIPLGGLGLVGGEAEAADEEAQHALELVRVLHIVNVRIWRVIIIISIVIMITFLFDIITDKTIIIVLVGGEAEATDEQPQHALKLVRVLHVVLVRI